MAYQNKKILNFSKKADTHSKALQKIAFEFNLTHKQASRIIEFFFARGVNYCIETRKPLKINKFGTIYFHKKTLEAYHKKKKK